MDEEKSHDSKKTWKDGLGGVIIGSFLIALPHLEVLIFNTDDFGTGGRTIFYGVGGLFIIAGIRIIYEDIAKRSKS